MICHDAGQRHVALPRFSISNRDSDSRRSAEGRLRRPVMVSFTVTMPLSLNATMIGSIHAAFLGDRLSRTAFLTCLTLLAIRFSSKHQLSAGRLTGGAASPGRSQ